MSFTRYKKLSIIEKVNNVDVLKYLKSLDGKYLVSNEYIEGYVPVDEITKAIRAKISRRFFKLYLLHEDETIKENITEQVVLGGSLEKTYQQGQTRSLSITLMNPTDIWNPSPVNGKLWANTKFKLEMGITLENSIYWVDEGIYVTQDPDLNNTDSNKTVALSLFDKFALLDGTISGKTETDYQIPLGTNIKDAIIGLLRLQRTNLGDVYDSKTIIFPNKYNETKTPYTLKKTSNSNIGEIIIELANMISCDVFYNENGNLVLRSNLDDIDYHNRSVSWEYKQNELETNGTNMKVEWSKIRNKFIVIGSNVNGMVFKGIAENTNPMSAYNINSNFGIKTEIITDNLIYSPELCENRAKYELKKNNMKYISVKFNSIYIPHILPNDLVRWSFDDYNFQNEIFAVQSVSIPLNPKEQMSLSITNIKELTL